MVVSNDINNRYSPVISIVPLTGHLKQIYLSTYVPINRYGLYKPSLILAEQIQALDKSRFIPTAKEVEVDEEPIAELKALVG